MTRCKSEECPRLILQPPRPKKFPPNPPTRLPPSPATDVTSPAPIDRTSTTLVQTSTHKPVLETQNSQNPHNMAEPQPPNVQEGADPPDALPANAEDRKAAAALNSLDARPDEGSAPKKEVDLKALNDAMKALGGAGTHESAAKKTSAAAGKKEEPKKVVKVDAGDVSMLVSDPDDLWGN